jgi:hypothetical protein
MTDVQFLSSALVLAMLVIMLRLIVRGRPHRFDPGTALTRVHRSTGNNATLVLACVALLGMAFDAAALTVALAPGSASAGGAPLALVLIAAVVGLVVRQRQTETVLALVATVLMVATIARDHGPEALVLTVAAVALLLWLLGVARGLLGR